MKYLMILIAWFLIALIFALFFGAISRFNEASEFQGEGKGEVRRV